MARVIVFFLAFVLGSGLQAQQKTRKIRNFSVEMRVAAGMTGTTYLYTIDRKGNLRYTRTVRDTVKSTITRKLSKKELTDLQEAIVNKAGVYDIPDKVNCDYCADGIDITIRVFSNRGSKTINGNNPQRVNEEVSHIYKLIKSLVREPRD